MRNTWRRRLGALGEEPRQRVGGAAGIAQEVMQNGYVDLEAVGVWNERPHTATSLAMGLTRVPHQRMVLSACALAAERSTEELGGTCCCPRFPVLGAQFVEERPRPCTREQQ